MLDLNERPISGAGVGLRSCHYDEILNKKPDIPWFEALSDNYFDDEPELEYLKAIRALYPITLHGVGMSLGSTDSLDQIYLKKIKALADVIQPAYISDHLSWSSINQKHVHDLLPLPFTEEAINHVSARISMAQDILETRILIENPSRYLSYKSSEMSEWTFVNAVADKADCYILLDVNNIYVTASNQNFNPLTYIQNIDEKRVKQFHLAGYSDEQTYLFDMHNQPVHAPVWSLYEVALKHIGARPTLIEWDDHIPALQVIHNEAKKAEYYMKQCENVDA